MIACGHKARPYSGKMSKEMGLSQRRQGAKEEKQTARNYCGKLIGLG
jgi:hypothetical protein